MLDFPDDGDDFELGSGALCSFYVRANGSVDNPRQIRISHTARLSDLLENAARVLSLSNPQKAYFSTGMEVEEIEDIEDNEVIIISCGERFKPPPAGSGGEVIAGYVVQEILGEGGFGRVMKGLHAETGEVVAIKYLAKKSINQISDLQRVFTEMQALRGLKHPNVIAMLDAADEPDHICFIMEYAGGGELKTFVEERGNLTEEEGLTFFQQIVKAVHFCHSKRIIHRDLKLENILLDDADKIKIADFGLSDFVAGGSIVTDAGTEAYLAPEVFNGTSADCDPYMIDVWALGVILYAMLQGRLPFKMPDASTCTRISLSGVEFHIPVSAGAQDLINKILVPDPSKRMTLNDMSVHPWVTSDRFVSLAAPPAIKVKPPEEDLPERSSTPPPPKAEPAGGAADAHPAGRQVAKSPRGAKGSAMRKAVHEIAAQRKEAAKAKSDATRRKPSKGR
mmetsp:Transcript_18340/g.44168  ORF Transcript_18340/g.44168 Transcript_18340/m.44168 type:complete len:451 (-) Transcript_18340:157-1509(-)